MPTGYWIPFMRRKITLPIDDLLKRDKIDVAKFEFPPEKFGLYEGKLYGLPYGLPVSVGLPAGSVQGVRAAKSHPPT